MPHMLDLLMMPQTQTARHKMVVVTARIIFMAFSCQFSKQNCPGCDFIPLLLKEPRIHLCLVSPLTAAFFFIDHWQCLSPVFCFLSGQLTTDKMVSVNKIGHALHCLNPAFRKVTFSNKVKVVIRLWRICV